MADRSINPETNVKLDKLESTVSRLDTRLGQEAQIARENAAKVERAATRRAAAAERGTAPAAGPTEKATIDEATLSTERLVKAQADALAAARQRLAVEQEEGRVLAANAATISAQAERVRAAARQESPLLQAATRVQRLNDPALIQARAEQEAAIAARGRAYSSQKLLGPGPQPTPQLLLGAGPQPPPQRLLTAGEDLSKVAKGYGDMEHAQAAAETQTARSTQTTSLFSRELRELDAQLEYEARAYNLAADAAARHGLLTSETIGYMARGQVTARQFGAEILGTIGKFAGWTAAASLTFGAVRALGLLGKGAVDAASGVGLVSRVLNNVDSSKLQQSFRDLSAQFNVPIEDTVQAVYGSAKVFNDQADAVQGATVALYAMKVGELTAAQSTQYLNAIVNGFKLTAADLLPVLDSVNNVQNRFGGNQGQLIAGVAKAAGAFRLAGGNFRDLIALIETGTKLTGASGENVGTAISRAASRQLTPQGAAALRSVGITPGGGFMDTLTQAVKLAKDASPEQVNALARALVPSGGQFARFFIPIIQNPQLLRRIQGAAGEDQAQGSAARELRHALGQVNEQISAIGHGIERLGSAFASAGGLGGVGLLVRVLNQGLTMTTSLVEEISKIPGIKVALPFLELYGIVRALKFFNLGGSLPGAQPGSLRGGIQGLVTASPERIQNREILKDFESERNQLSGEAQNAARASRLAASRAKNLAIAAEQMAVGTEEQEAAVERANVAFRKSTEAALLSAQKAEEFQALNEREGIYRSLQRGGMAPIPAITAAGGRFGTGTLEHGAGGVPVEYARSLDAAAVADHRAAVEAEASARTRATAAADVVAAEEVAGARRVAVVREGVTTISEIEAVGMAAVATRWEVGMERITAATVAGFGVMGAAVRVGRAVPGAVRTGLGARIGGPVEALFVAGITSKAIYDHYDNYAKQEKSFSDAANAGTVNLEKTVTQGKAIQKQNEVTATGLLSDVAQGKVGDLYFKVTTGVGNWVRDQLGLFNQAKQDRENTEALASELAHQRLAQGTGITRTDRQSLIDEQLRNLPDWYRSNPAVQRQAAQVADREIAAAKRRGAAGQGTLLTTNQIDRGLRQRLADATSDKERFDAYDKASSDLSNSYATIFGGRQAKAASAAERSKVVAGRALLSAQTGDWTALQKALADGSISLDGYAQAITDTIAQTGVTGVTVKRAQYGIEQALTNLGKAALLGPAGQGDATKALKQIKDIQDSITGPAQQNFQTALSLAQTPQQDEAARQTYLDQAPRFIMGVFNRRIRAALADIARLQLLPRTTANLQALREDRSTLAQTRQQRGLYQPTFDATVLQQSQQHLEQSVFPLIDSRAALAEARTSDPTEKMRIALEAINHKIRDMVKAHLTHTKEFIDLQTAAATALQNVADNAVQQYDDQAAVADSAAGIGATQAQKLTTALNRSIDRLAFLRSHHASAHDISQQIVAVNNNRAAWQDYLTGQAQAYIRASANLAASGTTDPVKLADINLRRDIQLSKYAQTPAEKIDALATVRSDRQARRQAGWQDRLDTINFNLDMGRISKDIAATEIEALARRVKNNKAYKNQLLLQAHELRASQADASNYELNVGNIKFPTAYEVMRGIGQANKASSRTLSTGNVHATANATINVNVANRGDVGAVSDAIDTVLSTHVRSTLRAKGVLGG